MKKLKQYLEKLGACEVLSDNFSDLGDEIFTAKGLEFLSKANIPIETYKEYRDKINGIYTSDFKGSISHGIGINSQFDIDVSGVDEVHKFLFINSNVKIRAFDYAVIYIVNINSVIDLEKDDTVIIL